MARPRPGLSPVKTNHPSNSGPSAPAPRRRRPRPSPAGRLDRPAPPGSAAATAPHGGGAGARGRPRAAGREGRARGRPGGRVGGAAPPMCARCSQQCAGAASLAPRRAAALLIPSSLSLLAGDGRPPAKPHSLESRQPQQHKRDLCCHARRQLPRRPSAPSARCAQRHVAAAPSRTPQRTPPQLWPR